MKIVTRDKKELSMEECTELLQISKQCQLVKV